MSNASQGDEEVEHDDVKVLMKIVQVLECAPALRENGDKITMLTLSYKGEVEQPLMLDLKDTNRLASELLVSLSTHGNDTAREILDKYFVPVDGHDL